MERNIEKTNNKLSLVLKTSFVALTTASVIGMSSPLFASNPTSGQAVIINSVGVVVNGSAAASASSIIVVVNDSTGPCSTSTLAYGGVVTVSWNAANTHSATKCTNIVSVDVSAVKTSSGVVQYDSTANSTPPATATAATNFTAPTTPINNLALIVTGKTSAAQTGSATSWGSAIGVAPVYATTNGSLTTTGIMGSVGMAGLKAEGFMLKYGIRPAGQALYSAE